MPSITKLASGNWRAQVRRKECYVADTFRRRKDALVERSREFILVPRRPVIEKALGRQVSGVIRGSGISWELGRKRGPGIGM
ncbi:DUF3363 domain-containing protein [Pelagibius litoralis]|uniref:DUF3363 domain-containing protein n=1 Tax=Pelagibius litoralis TaxID=374515 RepID=A0A967EZS8_9PROT|nr:DUF3363 domain-containing protein [Pelagibius litoralis]NIA70412.1 DUF3363 domain-containing protein [Pelagibius litoralis]